MNIAIGGIYKHFKGNEYHVIGIAHHSETTDDMVIYRALYGEREVWVRPLSMFLENVERGGEVMQRFEFTGRIDENGTIIP